MHVLAYVLFFLLPVISIACLIVGIVKHLRLPSWLLVVSIPTTLVLAPWVVALFDDTRWPTGVIWALVASAMLLLGYWGTKDGWSPGRWFAGVGLSMVALPSALWVVAWLMFASMFIGR